MSAVDRYDLTQKTARVHFIPNQKVEVFVTLRTPDVIKVVSRLMGLILTIIAVQMVILGVKGL